MKELVRVRVQYATRQQCYKTPQMAFTFTFTGLSKPMRWRSWLMHYATSRKVASSIPNVVIGIFHWQSSRSQYGRGVQSISNRNECQEYFLGRGVCSLSWNLRTSTSYSPQGLSWSVQGFLYLLFYSLSRPMPGYYSNWTTTASWHSFSDSLFANYFITLRHDVAQSL
jgi:hypothetical protein